MNSTVEMVTKVVRLANLKRVCADRGVDVQHLVGMAGMSGSYSYWTGILNGSRSVGANKAREVEHALGLPLHWLEVAHEPYDPIPAAPAPREHADLVPDRRVSPAPPHLVDALMIKVMDIEASMGHGVSQLDHENVIMNMVVNESWLRRNASFSSPENLAIVTGIGDSMRPTFEDGDPLLVDRGVTEIRLDAIYVLSLGGELFIKRIQRRPDGSVLMISDNPVYPPHPITNGERDRFQVLGRVVMAWNSRRI